MRMDLIQWVSYITVFLAGAMVGATELMSRYPDSPYQAIRNKCSLIYLLTNAVGGATALFLIQTFKWDFGLGESHDPLQVALIQWLVAAFGAMSVLRSSLFTVRVGNTDLGVGPAAVLQIILNAADRQVDRLRAKQRSDTVKKAMAGIEYYAQIKIALPTHCMALMQNVSSDEEKRIRQLAENIGQLPVDESLKILNLGLFLMNVVGDSVLRAAVNNVVEAGLATDARAQTDQKH